MDNELIGLIVICIPYFVIQLFLGIYVYAVSKRIGIHRALWTILSLVPILGLFVIIYATLKSNLYMLDTINQVHDRVSKRES